MLTRLLIVAGALFLVAASFSLPAGASSPAVSAVPPDSPCFEPDRHCELGSPAAPSHLQQLDPGAAPAARAFPQRTPVRAQRAAPHAAPPLYLVLRNLRE